MAPAAKWRAAATCALLPLLLQGVQAGKQYTATCDPFNNDDPANPPWQKGCGCQPQTSVITLSHGASGYTSVITNSDGGSSVVIATPKPYRTLTRYVRAGGSYSTTSTTVSGDTVFGK